MVGDTNESSKVYEQTYVHDVYDRIAEHFSSTRHKPWPIVKQFLTSLPDGSVGIDVGCGNGKYLAVNPQIFIVGSDRSVNLAKIATRNTPHSVVVADGLDLPHVPYSFDFAISIAVLHHFSTSQRRVAGIKSVLDLLKTSTSKALFYVWALEQENSRRGWSRQDQQDVMVPWTTLQNSPLPTRSDCESPTNPGNITFLRYYHLYREGELVADIVAAGGRIVESGYEKDNWWAIATSK